VSTPAEPPKKPSASEPTPERSRLRGRDVALIAVWLVVMALLWLSGSSSQPQAEDLPYFDFVNAVDNGQVTGAEIEPDGTTLVTFDDGVQRETRIPVALTGDSLIERLEAADVEVVAIDERTSLTSALGGWLLALLPVFLLIGLVIFMARRASGMVGTMGMGRSRAKVFDADRPTTTFDDVAGYAGAKEEISEIVDFLREPDRYRSAGAIAPRGVLMTGPPGTGKTLMARALAGEVGVPFFSVTGSSFVEMFVGVGASRVRDLFEEARRQAPAIIFVDEIDAIGQRRSGGAVLANDEREQTLNQLLAEMDGFEATTGVIVLAATNRAETLDPALLRPGRFDRQVVIPLPNQAERQAILGVHVRGKSLSDEVELATLARQTPGFSGADLANLVNEAAIRAARNGRSVIERDDVDAAYDRILLGYRDRSGLLLPEERRAVAAHEAGHALVAALSEAADPVHRVTILPAGESLGNTQQLPEHERHLYSDRYLYDTLAVQLGGRAAELLVFGRASTGATNDLAVATSLATKMVQEYGLSEKLGPVSYPEAGPQYLTSGPGVGRRIAEDTQRIIDSEVSRIVTEALTQATQVLEAHRHELDQVTELLLHDETVEGDAIYDLLGADTPPARPQVLQGVAPKAPPDWAELERAVAR